MRVAFALKRSEAAKHAVKIRAERRGSAAIGQQARFASCLFPEVSL